MSDFDFTRLGPQSKPVKWNGKEYVLREPSEGAWSEYQGALDAAKQYDADGKFKGLTEAWSRADAVLVAGCLFEVKDGSEIAVPLSEVRLHWPHRVTSPMVDWLKEAGEPPAPDAVPK